MTLPRQLLAAARLDAAEVLRSRWIFFCAGVYALLAGLFVLVGLRESTILGFTGTSRLLLSFCHGLVLLLPLLALTASGQVVNRARDDGSLELLFALPIRRSAWFAAVSLVRYAVLLVPLALLMVGMGLYGQLAHGQAIPWPFLGRALLVCASLLFAFAGIGIAISTFVRNPARSTTYLILAWGLGVALLDFGLIGLMLRWRLDPQAVFTLAALNPVEAARVALLSGIEPDLGTLGPVGFYLAHRLGETAIFALGVLWPAAIGAAAWGAACWSFRKDDIV